MNEKPVRFGLVGYGLFGAHHARAITNTPGAELAAIAVISEKSRQAAREAHPSADIYEDARPILARDDIDVVDIVIPNQIHYEIALAALEARKHVLLEKPMALRVDHCDDLIARARDAGRLLAVGHELRMSSLWGGARRLIESDAIGDVRHVLIELSRFPYRTGSDGWRYDRKRVGNWVLEEPIHFFDLARWYLQEAGDPESVYARANAREDRHPELNDNFSAIVNFPGGRYAVVSQTLAAFGHHQTAKIAGDKGTIWASWSASDARADRPTFHLRYGLGDEVHEVEFSRGAGELLELADEIAAIVQCVRAGTPPPCTGEDGRWSTLLCLAAQWSVETGRVVSLAEYLDWEKEHGER